MRNVIIGLLGFLLTVGTLAAAGNLPTPANVPSIADTNDPVELDYQKLLTDDDAAIADVQQWLEDNAAAAAKGIGKTSEAMNERVLARVSPVRKGYEDFLKLHPEHTRAHIAYGSFLSDIHEEETAKTEYERALEIDPKNPAAWNDLANLLSHTGPVAKMFEYYTKAIDLNPREPVYYENLATCVYLYRTDARAFYQYTNDDQVFDKSLALYQQAFKLDPTNLPLATELAQTYYGITPTRTEDALNAWTNALKIAGSDLERQAVYVHLARFKLNAGRFDEAREDIGQVTDPSLAQLKSRILNNLTQRDKPPKTDAPPARIRCPSGRTCALPQLPGYLRA